MDLTKEMKETIRLYDEDAYGVEFDARVIGCRRKADDADNLYELELDRTLFFPEEGGQSPDKGRIDGADVLDVQIRNGVIIHTVNQPIEVGMQVHGKIDWNHRFSNMQQHSGEHIFSGLVHSRFGFDNVGFHLSDQIVTMDFNGVLTAKDVEEVEDAVNEAIAKNVEIVVTYPSKEELKNLEYRSKIEIEGQVRIVTVTGYDVCACCAPHVRRTGEIGMLKVMSVQNYKGGVRISILCGFRALMAFREKAAVIDELTSMFTCGQEMLVDNIAKQKSLNQTLKSELGSAKMQLMDYRLAEIPEDMQDVILFERDLDMNVVRAAVNKLTETREGVVALFVGDDESGYNYIVGSKTVDCREIAAGMKEELAARGGGSNRMIQGSLGATRENLKQFLKKFTESR